MRALFLCPCGWKKQIQDRAANFFVRFLHKSKSPAVNQAEAKTTSKTIQNTTSTSLPNLMKKFIIAAAVTLTGLFITAPEAEAGPRFSVQIGGGHGGHGHACERAPYIVRTIEVCRRCERVVSYYRPCGTPVYRHVTIITYRSIYSNGSSRTYTRYA